MYVREGFEVIAVGLVCENVATENPLSPRGEKIVQEGDSMDIIRVVELEEKHKLISYDAK